MHSTSIPNSVLNHFSPVTFSLLIFITLAERTCTCGEMNPHSFIHFPLCVCMCLVEEKPVNSAKRSVPSNMSLFKVRCFGLPFVSLHARLRAYILVALVLLILWGHESVYTTFIVGT